MTIPLAAMLYAVAGALDVLTALFIVRRFGDVWHSYACMMARLLSSVGVYHYTGGRLDLAALWLAVITGYHVWVRVR